MFAPVTNYVKVYLFDADSGSCLVIMDDAPCTNEMKVYLLKQVKDNGGCPNGTGSIHSTWYKLSEGVPFSIRLQTAVAAL